MNLMQSRPRLLTGTATMLLLIASQTTIADDVENAMRMCSVVDSMGAQTECAVTEAEHAVDVTIDTTAVDAAQFCAAYSEMLGALASMMSGNWKMRIFSNDTPDAPAAVCDLS